MKHELRIGNKVMLNGEIITVKSIEFNPVTEKHFIRIEEDFRQIITDFLEPIPLTEELLVKNCKFIMATETLFVKGRLVVNLYKGNPTYLDDITVLKIDGLHDLQNIFYYKYKQELTIEI